MKKIFRLYESVLLSVFCLSFCFSASVEAYQNVKIEDKELLVDFDQDGRYTPYLVKAMGYDDAPIGWFPSEWGLCQYTGDVGGQPQFDCPGIQEYETLAVLDRDLPLIKAAHANTLRTWGKVTTQLLQKANEYEFKVIAGYWIPYNIDFVNGDLTSLQADILNYVNTFKDDPAVLMWGIGNENEISFCTYLGAATNCDRDAQAKAFYTFLNETAELIKIQEGESFHPVMYVSADLGDIGTLASDLVLPALDVHGCNVYRGGDFGGPVSNFFTQYEARTSKPVLITEFGVDVWQVLDPNHPENGQERQDLQAKYMGEAWDTIMKNHTSVGGPSLGGSVFQYKDGWWKHEGQWSATAATHDYGFDPNWYFGFDGYVNQEWFGIMSVEKNSNPEGLDVLTPREAYYVIQEKFSQQSPWRDNASGFQRTNIPWNYTMGYHFTPQKDGVITGLGGLFYGTKSVKLWSKSSGTLLAQAMVSGDNFWRYAEIDPVAVHAGETYTVAATLAGSGASYRHLTAKFPRIYDDIQINGTTWIYGEGRPVNIANSVMYGQADVRFIPDPSENVVTPWKDNENGSLRTNQNWNYTMGYHFVPGKSGKITRLGGFFNGTKTVKLWNRNTEELLAEQSVSSTNSWSYVDIDPVNVQAGETYTVAVYSGGSGLSYRYNIDYFPQTYGDIIITGSGYYYGDGRPTNAHPYYMFGQVDVGFVAD